MAAFGSVRIRRFPNTRGIRNDVVAALHELHVPVVRWPGGCFADEYHWEDGIGPRDERPKMINTHWGGVVEDQRLRHARVHGLLRAESARSHISAATWAPAAWKR